MGPDIQPLLNRLEPGAITAIAILGLLVVPGVLAGIVAIVCDAWQKAKAARIDADLKRHLVERGLPPDDIVRIVTARPPKAVEYPPVACEAVVRDDDGDWVTALVLARGEGQYYVHIVGNDMDENEWVDADRIRFPRPIEPAEAAPLRKPAVESEL